MAELLNEFSWSKSRDETFRKCPRQYYFHYYGSWGGWESDCDPRVRRAYVLKQLVTRAMWAGAKVHDCIKRALRNLRRSIEPMPEPEAIATTLAIMRKDYLSSRRGDYRKNPKTCGFLEHEYGLPVADAEWKETADHVVRCLESFYRSQVFGRIRTLPTERWLDVEEFSSFPLDGVKVHVVLDFSYRDERDGVVIYDWKTGRADEKRNEVQLACYSFYATKQWGVAPERVTTVEFNLATGAEHPYHLGATGLASIRQYIQSSIRDMKLLLADPATNLAVEERFAFTENEAACQHCCFRAICPRWE
ncbi:MAG: PD-(D/E)XK nuclease family protein [Planctomycetes bacterium]|nr:PD-(D/E)XK nuclease family protein [Planctomycetota bacterium]